MIPYGDPNPTVHFKNVFDIGEYGMGPLVNQLELGCDCLGEIRYLDAPRRRLRAAGGAAETRSASTRRTSGSSGSTPTTAAAHDRGPLARLVVSCIATVGNYEYGFFWYLYQDGTSSSRRS